MERFVTIFAPKSKFDFLIKVISFLAMIVTLDMILEPLVFGVDVADLPAQAMITLTVGLPFVIFSFVLLRHQYQMQIKLADLAATDMLTGLLNRRAFLSEAEQRHSSGEQGAVILLDADYFKSVNDTYGHSVGDLCLKAIGKQIRALTRDADVVGRFGGEEFVVYLSGATPDIVAEIGTKMCDGIELSHHEHGVSLTVTLSAGGAMAHSETPLEQAIHCADGALYQAKNAGRAQLILQPAQPGSQPNTSEPMPTKIGILARLPILAHSKNRAYKTGPIWKN